MSVAWSRFIHRPNVKPEYKILNGYCFQLTQVKVKKKYLSSFSVRLVGGPDAREGRVEAFFSGVWSLVCGAGWDMSDAEVVCQSLGYGGASAYSVNLTIVNQANNTVWLSGVRCIGNETSLSECAHGGWGENSCAENRAAGVTCFHRGWLSYTLKNK